MLEGAWSLPILLMALWLAAQGASAEARLRPASSEDDPTDTEGCVAQPTELVMSVPGLFC